MLEGPRRKTSYKWVCASSMWWHASFCLSLRKPSTQNRPFLLSLTAFPKGPRGPSNCSSVEFGYLAPFLAPFLYFWGWNGQFRSSSLTLSINPQENNFTHSLANWAYYYMFHQSHLGWPPVLISRCKRMTNPQPPSTVCPSSQPPLPSQSLNFACLKFPAVASRYVFPH